MPVIRQYYQTASERQLLTVTYTCKHCGHQNIDNDQSFLFSGASRTSVNPHRKAAGAEAEASMDRNKQRILDQIYDDKYRNAGLHCRCENCGKKPLWSAYINTSWLLVIAIVGLFFLLGAFVLRKPMMFIPAAVLIFLETPRNGQMPRNWDSTILLTNIAEMNIKKYSIAFRIYGSLLN